ncbi:hypothetical protein [Pseudooceanicola sp. MF1-13]|uniref:hypothetical protein n=1 Tax=Pseudooceanicola sp. MF1-13 TaxID=3379095 RepID=UPI0038923074
METTYTDNIPPKTSSSTCLVDKTLYSVHAELKQYGLTLTDKMKEGLRSLATAMASMADGTLPPQVHLASLDPGLGKTTMTKHFLQHLLRSPNYQDVSVLVCVSRLGEVEKLYNELDVDPQQVAVLVGKDAVEVASLSDVAPSEARILITTQQMIKHRCRGGRFRDAMAFHYRGQPRQVLIWDEAFLPGEEIAVSHGHLGGLVSAAMSCRCEALAEAIQGLQNSLGDTQSGKLLRVPDMAELGGRQAWSALNLIAKQDSAYSEDVRSVAGAIMSFAGGRVRVRAQGQVKTMLDYRDTIPNDLAPMVVLDASGRCRHTYRLMEKHRGCLVRLKEVCKDYGNLTINLWKRGGGRHSFERDEAKEMVRSVAQAVLGRSEEEWLIIHHKDRSKPTFREELAEFLSEDVMRRVHLIHWGDHHGTNAFAHVSNVILAGTYFLPEATYESRYRMAAGFSEEDRVPLAARRALERGEAADAILQALCRGCVRGVGPDGRCKPCNAYIIASQRSGIPKLLPDLFPGCQLRSWKPLPNKLKGNVKKVIDYLDEVLWRDGDLLEFIPYKQLMQAVGIANRTNFRKTVTYKAEFQEAIAERGLEEAEAVIGGKKHKGLQWIVSAFPPDPDAETAYTPD